MEEVGKKNVVIHFATGSNCQVFNGNITGCIFAMPGSTVSQQAAAPQCDGGQPDVAALVACVERVREFLWSDSALAVVFCVCRDCYGYANNMSQFERDFHCHDGLLSNTFRSNPYMRMNISKWEQLGVKRRVLRLMEAYRNAVEDRLIA